MSSCSAERLKSKMKTKGENKDLITKDENKDLIKVLILFALGLISTWVFGRKINFFFVVSLLLWAADLVILIKGASTQIRKDKIRIGIIIVISANIVMVLGVCTKITAVMIVGAVIWEIASLVGVVIIWNELYKRIKINRKPKKTSNPSKKYEPKTQKVFKRVCAKCGAELQSGEKTFCRNCNYELQHTKCSECDSYFPKDDMHLVEEKYYCQACFKKKFADFGAYENSEDQTALERERESAVNNEVPENEYQSMAENKAAVKTLQSDADNKTITCFMMIKDLFTVRSKNMPSKNILNQFCKANVYIIYSNFAH